VDPLDALLARLIPTDETPGAAEVQLGDEVRRRVPDLETLLARLGDFSRLSSAEQDAVLAALDSSGDPLFAAVVVAAHELFYANPLSWSGVGYTTRLPGRP
jgi:hypothetical protein